MAYEEKLRSITVPANADLSSYQFRFMTVNSSGKISYPSGQGVKVDGVLQNKPAAADRAGTLAVEGVTKLEVASAVTAGDDLTPAGTSGKGETASTSDVVAARALEDGSGDGSIIAVLLRLQAEPLS